MKRLIVLFILLFTLISANPIATPDAYLSEICIDSIGNWELELYSEVYHSFGGPWTSQFSLETNSGRANITHFDSTKEYIRITNANLDSVITMNILADSIRLLVHGGNPDNPGDIDAIAIGEENGSYIKNIQSGQSVSRLIDVNLLMSPYDMFYKSDSSTIGEENDTSYAKGTVYGHVYCHDGSLMKNRRLWIHQGYSKEINVDNNGFYLTRLLSRNYQIDTLWVSDPEASSGENICFNRIEFDLEPDDSLEVNFTSVQSSITPVIQNTIKFNNYPHPASNYTWFFIDNIDIEASAMRVNVYALNGRKVDSFKPRAYQYRYDCSHLPQGSYIMSLQ
ncbi:MAG: hypothetical protein KAH32_09130, partial [Chlamydiia bacterium]|nr:hypothetical protein [Chlamydiia bacterium]